MNSRRPFRPWTPCLRGTAEMPSCHATWWSSASTYESRGVLDSLRVVPNLYFYATHEDRQPVLDAILGFSFRALQAQSDPDRALQELTLGDAVPLTPFHLGLVAWRDEFGAEPTFREYNVRETGGAHYRRIEALGWG